MDKNRFITLDPDGTGYNQSGAKLVALITGVKVLYNRTQRPVKFFVKFLYSSVE